METQKNVFYNVLLALSQVLFPMLTFPYLARVLGPAHVGVLNFAESYARYFVLVAAVGIPVYGVREVAKVYNNKKALSQLFVEIFSINLITTIVLTFVFGLTIININKLNAERSLFYWSLLFFFLQVFLLEWFFIGMKQFKFIAIRFFFIRLLFIICVFTLIKSSADYLIYMRMQVFLNLVLSAVNIYYVFKFIAIDKVMIAEINLKKHIKPLLLLFLTIFFISIYLQLDTVILGFLTDSESVGYYSSALKLNKLLIAVFAAISAAMFPKMMNLLQEGNIASFDKMIQDCFYVILSFSLPTATLVVMCAPEIVQILFGNHFERAILPLQITAPIIVIVSLSTIFGFQILSALAKDKSILVSAILGTIVSLVFSILFVQLFKEVGESITIVFTELTVCCSFIYFSRKYFNINKFTTILVHQIIAIVPVIFFVLGIKYLIENLYERIISISIITIVWYFILHYYILSESVLKIEFLKLTKKHLGSS
jgi:O-antigen/teichoic acid export membrane protein